MHDSVMTVGVFGEAGGTARFKKRKRFRPDLVRNFRSCPSKLIMHLRLRLVWAMIVPGIVGSLVVAPRIKTPIVC